MRSESRQNRTAAIGEADGKGWHWRPPLLLYSYIANELLAPFFASFLILYCVFFLVRLIPLLEIVLSLRIGLADFIRLFAYIFPHMLLYIIPMASMAGVIVGFTRLTNDREILAFKACGVSLKQMLPPVVLVAAATACLTGFFAASLIPAGALGVKHLMFQLAKEKIDKGLKAKEFTEALGDIVLYVDEIDDQQRWHGVYVSDMRGRTQPLITVAQSGHLEADMDRMQVTVILNNGTIHNNEGTDNQVIRFGRYQLQISLQPPTQIGKEDVANQSRGAMGQEQLLTMAEKLPPDSKLARSYLSEYHHRLVLPVGCFILSLIGLPLGLQAAPGRRAVGLPLGLLVFVGYYINLTVCRNISEAGAMPLVPGMWLPNVLFFLLALYLFQRVYVERPLVPERIAHPIQNLHDRLLLPLWKRFGRLAADILARWQRQAPSTADHNAGRLAVRADRTTGLYHLPHCVHYYDPQCRLQFRNVEIAREAGFAPCPLCTGADENREPER
ncbi:MAG: LPS export ABC transporter permease LptF [Desulfobulbus sp.]|jgi:lipopolysaccharide export system permease protein|uniref:LPS export ABC transporter permease LptF n=1 Tax=Desulfobulbus sp. TaxID=895 RepID=UPI0028414C34|nr:LPS export ABC transporter permease LptF [Desulfobulbus sp.]MDR2550917.1 LPS export ABC transporter permease LptF [Desulfobulbus sp.]